MKLSKKKLEKIVKNINGTLVIFENSKTELDGYSIQDNDGKITVVYDPEINRIIMALDYGKKQQETYSFTVESSIALAIMLHKAAKIDITELYND